MLEKSCWVFFSLFASSGEFSKLARFLWNVLFFLISSKERTWTFWKIKHISDAWFLWVLIGNPVYRTPISTPQSITASTNHKNNSLPSPRYHPNCVSRMSPGLCCSVSSSPFWAPRQAELLFPFHIVWFNYIIYICLVWIFICTA